MVQWASAALSAVCAALATTGITLAIEKLGGTLGGVLGSTPTTIIPSTIGVALALAPVSLEGPVQNLQTAMYTTPLGMLLNVTFLFLWRELPRTRCFKRPFFDKSIYRLVFCVGATTLCLWGLGAATVVFSLRALRGVGVSPRVWGLTACLGAEAFALVSVFKGHVPSAASGTKVRIPVPLARGLLAALAIFTGVAVSQINAVAAGMMIIFPAVYLTTMASLWMSQGHGVPAGAVGPMMLGSQSIGVYAMCFSELLPAIMLAVGDHSEGCADSFACLTFPPSGGALALSAFLCYLIAVLGVSIPTFFLLRCANKFTSKRKQRQVVPVWELTSATTSPVSSASQTAETITITTPTASDDLE